MTELRRKMIEELQLRNCSPNTQRAYTHCVAAKGIAEAGDDSLVWPEFANSGDDELKW